MPGISTDPNEGFDAFADLAAASPLSASDIAAFEKALDEGLAMATYPFRKLISDVERMQVELDIYAKMGVLEKEAIAEIRASMEQSRNLYNSSFQEYLSTMEDYNENLFTAFHSTKPFAEKMAQAEANANVQRNIREYDEALKKLERKMERMDIMEKELDREMADIRDLDPIEDRVAYERAIEVAEKTTSEIITESSKYLGDESKITKLYGNLVSDMVAESASLRSEVLLRGLGKFGGFLGKVSEIFIPETKLAALKFQTASDIAQGGFQKFFDKMTVAENWEVNQEIWTEMRKKIASEAHATEDLVKDELIAMQALAKSGASEEALYSLMVSFNAPSTRLYASALLDAAQIAPDSLVTILLMPLRSTFYLLRASALSLTGSAMSFIEREIGIEASVVLAEAVEGLGIYAKGLINFALSETGMVFFIIGQIVYYIARDGFTRKLEDDLLHLIFLSLEEVEGVQKFLDQYPETSTPAKVKRDSAYSNMIKLQELDYKAMKTTVDFWGKIFIDSLRREGHMYPEYKPMPTFDAQMVVPGRYINLKSHPYDSEFTVQTCQRIEREIASGRYDVEGIFRSGSEVDHLLPKKKGYVRNFAAFPLYETSMTWPDYVNGQPVVRTGHFRPKELDPTLVATFKLWATTGNCGPIYNAAKDPVTREKAAAAIRADVKQWLEMDPKHPTAWLELKKWAGTSHGKLAATYPEMLLLAPKSFNKEWSNDIILGKGWEKMQFLFIKHSYEYVKEIFVAIGRYPFTPSARKFYEDCANGIFNYAAEIVLDRQIVWVVKQRKATPAEIKQWTPIHQDALRLRKMFDDLKQKTEQQYKQLVLQTIWPLYVRLEKPDRTLWSYIQHHRAFFIEELSYYAQYLNQRTQSKLWSKWIQARDNAEVPLNMNSAHRAYFMGKFAELAYAPLPETGKKGDMPILEKQLQQKFQGFDENILVTTKEYHGHWAALIKAADIFVVHKDVDFPVEFGDLMCRVIVLHEPRTLILAFKGTSTLLEIAIDADFSSSSIGHLLDQPTRTMDPFQPPIEWLPRDSFVQAKEILHGEDYMQVHRGFHRAVEAFAKHLTPIMNNLKRKYQGTARPIRTVNYCGHSLGGAMAQVACLFLPRFERNQLPNTTGFFNSHPVRIPPVIEPNLYCISSPRVGDNRYTNFARKFTNEVVHIWTDGDVVTALPPFLYPSRDISAEARQEQWQEIKAVFDKDPEVAFLFIGLEKVLHAFHLPDLFSPLEWASFKNHVVTDNIDQVLGRIVWGASQMQAQRANGTFFRVSPIKGGVPVETNRDVGNTQDILRTMQVAGGPEYIANLHSITQTLARFKFLVDERNDIFSDVSKDLPGWIHGGSVPQPKPPAGGQLSPEVQQALLGENSRIIGTVRTMHQHPIYSQVPQDDIQPGSFMFNPFEIHEIEDIYRKHLEQEQQTTQSNRNKRKHIEFHLHE